MVAVVIDRTLRLETFDDALMEVAIDKNQTRKMSLVLTKNLIRILLR